MRLLVDGDAQAEEEERLIAERKRKREEIEALHRRKQQEEERGLEAMADAAEGADRHKRAKAAGEDGEEAAAGAAGGAGAEGQPAVAGKGESSDEDEGEDLAGPLEVRVHRKPIGDDDEVAAGGRPGSSTTSSGQPLHLNADGASRGGGGGNPSDEAIRNGQREPSEEEPEILLDMFALSPSQGVPLMGQLQAGLGGGGSRARDVAAFLAAGAGAGAAKGVKDVSDSLEDNWDDPEGYYKTLVGELIGGRYLVLGAIGRGVFSTVLKCQDKAEDDKPVVRCVVVCRVVVVVVRMPDCGRGVENGRSVSRTHAAESTRPTD